MRYIPNKCCGIATAAFLYACCSPQGVDLFQSDDFVVYPAQGVGKIERVDHQEIGGISCEFYIVRIVANNVTLMVPVQNAANVGLRRLIDKEQAQTVLNQLLNAEDASVYTGQNWNRRYREYSDKLKSSDPAEVAIVVRELLLIGRVKELSFGERRLLEQAMALVIGELAVVLALSETTLRDTLQAAYAPLPADPKA